MSTAKLLLFVINSVKSSANLNSNILVIGAIKYYFKCSILFSILDFQFKGYLVSPKLISLIACGIENCVF